MNMKNDVAFLLADRLNLYEHQSTYNPNMPLRDLFYICREYEKLVGQKSLYSSTKTQIPNPHFIVFYNGVDWQEAIQMSIFEYDEEKEMRLLRQAERQGYTEESICNLMETMKLSLSQAMDALKIPAEDRSMYAARIQRQQ